MSDERRDPVTMTTELEHRMRRVEKANGILGIALAIVVSLGTFLSPPAESNKLIRARRLQVIDAAGCVRVDLRHDSTETGLFVLDESGDPRLGAAHFAHGSGGFALHGPGLKGAAVLYLKGEGSLTFYDSAGTETSRVPANGRR